MRRRKHRTCAILLCVVLTISNILSAGMPVYASAPNPDTGNADTAYTDEAVSPTTSDHPPGQHDSADATAPDEEDTTAKTDGQTDQNPEYPAAYPSGFYLNDITVTPRM